LKGNWNPPIPSGLVSVVFNATQANLTGTYSGIGEDGFKWEKSVDNGATYVEIGTTGSGVKTYSDTSVSTREKYMYRFRAYKGNKYSDYSPVSTIDVNEWLGYWQMAISAILNTTNCPARYDYTDLTTLTKDGSTQKISRWNDKLGSGHDLLQATSGSQPVWSTRGILLTQQFMKTSGFTYAQGNEIFMLIKVKNMINQSYFFDGSVANSALIWNNFDQLQIKLQAYAGTLSAENFDLVSDLWTIVRVYFNGASSEFQIDDNAITYWNCGAGNMGGFTLAAKANGVNMTDMEVKDILLTKGGWTTGNKNIIYDYLKIRKYFGDLTDERLLSGAVCLTFDDYPESFYVNGYAGIQARGIKFGAAVPISFLTITTWPYMQTMYADGHEIMNHTQNHANLSTKSAAEIETEVSTANASFAAKGINVISDFAYPISGYTITGDKLDVIKAHFNLARQYSSLNVCLTWKNTDKYNLPSTNYQNYVNRVNQYYLRIIDYAKFMKCCLILTNHNVSNTVGQSIIPVAWLNEMIDYGQSVGIGFLKLSELNTLMTHV
jgi:peptidoglycan/xylan/chitin deacetylase (PgdA/CDA1 family)